LTAQVFEEAGGGREPTVATGVLLCERCRAYYPIEHETPVLLKFRTGYHDGFEDRYRSGLQELPGYRPPAGDPRPGEMAVQETFTDEWDLLREDELSFMYTHSELIELNSRVWLPWLAELEPDERPRRVLDVGCGAGNETNALNEIVGPDEIFGVDLNFSVMRRRAEYRGRPGMSFAVASLFDLPFEPGSFDLVYSQGVIHHTYSTEHAFRSIARFVAPGGSLFVWVYGLDDHLSPGGASKLSKRANRTAEGALRPLLSRAPRPVRDRMFELLTAAWHPRMRRNERHGERWTRANTNHALRDWLSPPYAHRHGFNEVAGWYEDEGFSIVGIQSAGAYEQLFGRPIWGVGMTGRKPGFAHEGEQTGSSERALRAG